VCDWSARSADEAGSKNDTITGFWSQERCYRPVVALDLLPSNESIILTVYDFHFCIWKNGIDVSINLSRFPYSAA
jgi:dynein intermediate chain 3, axonemal